MIHQHGIAAYYLGRIAQHFSMGDLLSPFYDQRVGAELVGDIENAVKDVAAFGRKRWESVFDFSPFRLVLYALVRERKPELFVETGVLHGFTSNFILSAMRHNGCGRLISVDLPSYAETGPANQDGFTETLPQDCQPGWMISRKNRPLWKLYLGRSEVELPKIKNDFKPLEIDMFLHDSENRYDTIWLELQFAWEHLRSGGLLICDNIACTTAFFDFCHQISRLPIIVPDTAGTGAEPYSARFGIVKK